MPPARLKLCLNGPGHRRRAPIGIPSFWSDPDYGPEGNFGPRDFTETPTSNVHTIYLNGNAIQFAVTAGHLKAEGSRYPSASSHGKAAIFYTAYTRDELPKGTRPVTFIFNGGPGGASAVLDLNFLGPKRIDWNAPQSATLPLVDNPNTLLEKTDLVFVDPVGTGYSKAVYPSRNDEFWSVDEDASVLTDFIIRYINANHRQESPKYMYGVSYGGIRAPVIGRMLLESGTAKYADKKNSKNVLTGLILNSPMLDYEADCLSSYVSCGGSVPTYAMVADYHKKSTERSGRPIETFLADVRPFVLKYNDNYKSSFSGVDQRAPDRSKWEAFLKQPEAPPFLNRLYQLTGIGKIYEPGDNASNNPWIAEPNMDSFEFGWFFEAGKDRKLLLADGRETIAFDDTDFAIDRESYFSPLAQRYQEQFIGYYSNLRYMRSNGEIIGKWDFWSHHPDDLVNPGRFVSSVPDLSESISLKPDLKILVQHGYYDLNTPFHQSELVLAALPEAMKVPVKLYEAGHGIGPEDGPKDKLFLYTRVRNDLNAFYDQPAGMLTAMWSPSRGAEPPSKRSKQGAVPLTRESVSAAVDARIRALFDRAADPAIQLVTLSSAEKSGVGYFIGQFADMDRDSDGALSFKEVKGFFDAQSPIAKPESKAQQGIEKQEIQIIE
ncbi:S10 family serine carboxypeptidase-like protein [Phyllobacterium zundukense]|nr:hypothetical protein [Phyllobacterium zundukense]ATU93024.1 hypothetical protein BLM14_16440 [Phyllobacterium zundukense]